MKKLLAIVFAWGLFCCAVNAQSPGAAPMVPGTVPFTGFALLAKSGVASSITGTLTETSLAAVTIPANALGANGQVKINVYWTMTNSANTKTLRVRLGGLGGTAILNTAPTTVGTVWSATVLLNTNATNAQSSFTEVMRGTDGLVTTPAPVSSALDMTQSQSLVISGQLTNVGETITVVGYTVELCN